MVDITGYSFINDIEKMHDFMILNMDEFLLSYSYLNENDYYATYNDVMEIVRRNENNA